MRHDRFVIYFAHRDFEKGERIDSTSAGSHDHVHVDDARRFAFQLRILGGRITLT
jgi:hypothetical protein